jgi:uncharacterized membrane protein YoaK (UPF0700 family)
MRKLGKNFIANPYFVMGTLFVGFEGAGMIFLRIALAPHSDQALVGAFWMLIICSVAVAVSSHLKRLKHPFLLLVALLVITIVSFTMVSRFLHMPTSRVPYLYRFGLIQFLIGMFYSHMRRLRTRQETKPDPVLNLEGV